jgi:hypothetical protein
MHPVFDAGETNCESTRRHILHRSGKGLLDEAVPLFAKIVFGGRPHGGEYLSIWSLSYECRRSHFVKGMRRDVVGVQ